MTPRQLAPAIPLPLGIKIFYIPNGSVVTGARKALLGGRAGVNAPRAPGPGSRARRVKAPLYGPVRSFLM